MLDNRNVMDCYKGRPNEEIIADLETQKSNFSILCVNTEHDLNLSNIVRSANAFGAKEVILYGRRHFDRRGCVGSYKYLNIRSIKTIEELEEVFDQYYRVIAVENNVGGVVLSECNWDKERNYLFVFGQESCGITADILERCHFSVEIEQVGSVRSLNLATAAGIIMYEVMRKAK